MMQKIFNAEKSIASLFIRLALAIVILPHGIQKVSDFSNILEILNSFYGLPTFIGVLVILIEFLAPMFLILGLFTRANSLIIGFLILGASYFHLENGFFINWFGSQAGEGVQFHILFVLTALGLSFIGGGKWSIDFIMQNKLDRKIEVEE
ncbi:DoxX family protein [Aureivirga marina]|uniref:DoxX family protein n=1 Tax=Aureivirga marina TaxID=1182451 RepID=UPI0018CADC6B|nr:DoxX family protein [Aureivirga marina]